MKLCDVAIKNSGWVWNRLREARNNDFQIGEESLTDFFILNLKKHGRGKISVDTFTRHEESLTGADWEWWFTGPSGKWLGMRVQAKVINLKNEAFEHIHYKNSHGFQVDTLIKDAAKNKLIPLYCMYTNWEAYKYKSFSVCKCLNSSIRHFGASLLSPDKVIKLRPKKKLSAIIKSLRPLHCIFCCSGYGGTDLPERAFEYFKSTGLTSTIKSDTEDTIKSDTEDTIKSDTEDTIDFLKDKPPYYVTQLLEGDLDIDFMDIQDENLKRVTVIRELNSD